MGSRQHKRTMLKTQVRIFGTDVQGNPFTRLAETVDVSPCSVRLSGVYVDLHSGDEIDLECDAGRARFRVVWQGKIGTPEAGEIALYTLDPVVVLWPTDEPDWIDTFDESSMAPERRFYRRFECDLVAYLTVEGESVTRQTRCVDLSFGGCYLTTEQSLPIDCKVSVTIHGPLGPPLSVWGFVRTLHPRFGMGVRFTCVEDPKVLAALLDGLRKTTPVPASASASATPSVASHAPDALGKKILVVDDSLAARSIAAHHLRRHGYTVVAAKDGEEGLALARSGQPDLVLLDILLPRLSGLAVLRRLKADPATQAIPVVVVSSLSEDNDARMLAEGACGYLPKATTPPDQLPRLVDRTFRHLLTQGQH
jgi:CheY-like chemotaxis protein